VSISGHYFTGALAVEFDGQPAPSFTVNNDGSITATSPAGAAGTVDVTVVTLAGQSATSAADQFTYVLPLPTVTGLNPTSGPLAGGTSVVVTGQYLTGAVEVLFGNQAAPSITVNSDSQVTAVSPAASSAGTVEVTVVTPTGVSNPSPVEEFTYVAGPTVGGISPSGGPTTGGTQVTITGSGFMGASAVSFGGTPATSFTVNSDSQVTATSPAGAAGTVDVTVTTVYGTSTTSPADQFTYNHGTPTVTLVSPPSGPVTGGTVVNVSGTNFTSGAVVRFGGVAVTTVYVISAGSLVVVSPAAPAGPATVDVTVTTTSGSSATNANDHFTYVAPVPAVSGLSPTSGPTAGGATVTVTGSGFTGASIVDFGSTAVTSFTVNSTGTQLTVTSPTVSPAGGTVDVTVTTPGGISATSANDRFDFVPAPTVTNLSASSGLPTGWTFVTVDGTNFIPNASTVKFGNTVSPTYVVLNSGALVAFSPPGTGTVDITVTTAGGTSATSTVDQFTYKYPVPTVSGLRPTTGPAAGGTVVTITGTNFSTAATVKFGNNTATSVTVNSGTSITATSPSGTGTVDVTVTTAGGTTAVNATDKFTYVGIPAVTAVSPASGPLTGGTLVTITGSNFTSPATVKFGATASGFVSVNSPTSITALAPASTSAGTVDITVTTAGGTSATVTADQYTYKYAVPVVSSVSPNTGSHSGGTVVTITGSGFAAGATVTFGSNAATSVVVNGTGTQITATSPTGNTGSVDITVTTAGGTSATTTADKFTYV
jgi:hypothetical protein